MWIFADVSQCPLPYRVCVYVFARGECTHPRFLFVGAAAARGQAGKRDSGSSTEHHREVHLPSQVQEGKLTSRSACRVGRWGGEWSSWSWCSLKSRGSSVSFPGPSPAPLLVWSGGLMTVSHWYRRGAGCMCVHLWVVCWVGVQADECVYLNVEGQGSTSTRG